MLDKILVSIYDFISKLCYHNNMKSKKMKSAAVKKIKKAPALGAKRVSALEKEYLQFIVPMSDECWSTVQNLSQPSILKKVPSKTAYFSSVE
ncbi:MAG TPA: hypothetical protein PLO23_00805 [Alphaproteobacteria bacterium]|nr:hypothetical protein [Alphaproteobacteria bacterium]